MATVYKAVESVRCWRCDKLLADRVATPYRITCPRCKATNQG